MNPNIGNVLRDRRFQIAAAAVAAIAVVVFVRKGKGSDANADAEPQDGSTPTRGTFDTTGTDMASWISAYTRDVLAAIQAAQQNQGNGGQSTPPPTGPVPYVPVPRMPSPVRNRWSSQPNPAPAIPRM